jgi:hypothetical protein
MLGGMPKWKTNMTKPRSKQNEDAPLKQSKRVNQINTIKNTLW